MDKTPVTTQSDNEPKIKWLLVDIGNVLLLKDTGNNFSELLAKELDVDIELAKKSIKCITPPWRQRIDQKQSL